MLCRSRARLQVRAELGRRLEAPERHPAAVQRARGGARCPQARDHKFSLRGRGQSHQCDLPLDLQQQRRPQRGSVHQLHERGYNQQA